MFEQQTVQDVIYLASCAVNKTVPDQARVAAMDLQAVYSFASSHMITAVAAFALNRAGCKDERTVRIIAAAQRKAVIYQHALSSVEKALEENGIWYMPLKGAVLKNFYPALGMREYSDHDLLFDASRAEDVRKIMESLGFIAKRIGRGVHDIYYKDPGLIFEMHTALFGPQHKKLWDYYQHVEERLAGDGFEKHFTAEDLYLYLLAHEHKHYADYGTGMRSLLDTYIFLKNTQLNPDYIAEEARKLGLKEFEEKNRFLSLRLFGGGELTDADREMLEFILSSGTYGSVSNKMQKNEQSKLSYLLSRFFVPVSKKSKNYAAYASVYPLFYRHRVLLPLLPFYRTFQALKSGRFQSETRAVMEVKDEPRPK